jgi:hypothetical protein
MALIYLAITSSAVCAETNDAYDSITKQRIMNLKVFFILNTIKIFINYYNRIKVVKVGKRDERIGQKLSGCH